MGKEWEEKAWQAKELVSMACPRTFQRIDENTCRGWKACLQWNDIF